MNAKTTKAKERLKSRDSCSESYVVGENDSGLRRVLDANPQQKVLGDLDRTRMDESRRGSTRGRGRGRAHARANIGNRMNDRFSTRPHSRYQRDTQSATKVDNQEDQTDTALGAVGGGAIQNPYNNNNNNTARKYGGRSASQDRGSRRSVGHSRGSRRGSVDSRNEKRGEFKTKQNSNFASGRIIDRGRSGRGLLEGRQSLESRGSISFRILKSWCDNKDGEDVLMQMSNRIESLEKLLMNDTLDEAWYECLVQVFLVIMTCQTQSVKLKRILQMLSTSQFLTLLLTNYLDSKQDMWTEYMVTDAEVFFKSVLKIVQEIVKRLPDNAQNVKSAMKYLQVTAKCIFSKSTNKDLHDLIEKVNSTVIETHESWVKKQVEKKFYRPSSDSETPPEDFRELSVLPTKSDLSSDANPFVRAVITKGVYKDQEHYLDVQFRLMREDFVKPLRNGIQQYRVHKSDKKFKYSDIRLYHDVHFTGLTHIKGIDHVVQFDVSNMRHVKWDHSKRLLNGNLVCLSNDHFESTLIFATVSFRDTKLLRRGIINIECHSGIEIVLKASPMDVFVMAETVAYYEAVYPILKGLQTIDSDLPFKEQIVSSQKRLKPPAYLLKDVRKYDISCLMSNSQTKEVSVLNTLTWPLAGEMNLNPSQRDAAILALTKEISVIQGPPGTGKTYVGLKIMEVLLGNQDRIAANTKSRSDPVLVICYTNHALDQFLEGIHCFCPNGIIRVGGKSSSEVLENCALKNKKNKRREMSSEWTKAINKVRNNLKFYSQEIERVKKSMDSLKTDVFSENVLENFITREHFHSLKSEPKETKRKSKVHQWLNAPNKSLLQTLPRMIKDHMTKLVMRCLQLITKPHHELKKKQFIMKRVQIYQSWLNDYQRWLVEGLVASKDLNPADEQYFLSLHHRSRRPFILNDSELCNVIPADIFKEMSSVFLKDENFVIENQDHLVEAWVLGLHNDCSRQLDDVEELTKFIQRVDRPEDKGEDDFDDEEECKIALRQRQCLEDADEEKKCFDATLKVTNDGSFLLHRAKYLGISENVEEREPGKGLDDEGFQTVTYKKPYTILQVERILSNEMRPPMSEHEERAIDDVWALNAHDRFSLYKLWMKRYKESLVEEMESLIKRYKELKQELAEARVKEDITIMKRARVIGMTTTGAAKRKACLDSLGCRIIVVEEAAEVLEAHIVTALNENCQHLILIGDHKQLRPNPTVYEHAKNFGLDVSLFERLVNNEIPHVTLSEQHRMRESISVIMRHIYPNLQDHLSVRKYENIRGVSKNIFFIQHDHDEEIVKDSRSKSNPYEAEYLMRLCKYFLLQGYASSQITILATYGGQVLALKKEMAKQNFLEEEKVRISTVDNFQGEENDIILLSLVRSNKQNVTGFLKVDNRVCVALSRAKKGMFAIGNLELLASQSNLWERIKNTAELEEITGDGLPISCPNHPDEKSVIKAPENFDCSPEGGCLKKCEFRLDCGHTCHLTCHGYDRLHEQIKCFAPCTKSCPEGHPCQKKCWRDCGDCVVQVPKKIEACGHTNSYECSKIVEESDCYSRCEVILPCGHECTGICGKCKSDSSHPKCEVPMTYIWPCDHAVEVPCYFKPTENPCPKPCREVLDCGHICPGKCMDCLQGAIHVACADECSEVLICGHRCQGICGAPCPPCSLPCPMVCRHQPCKLKCGEPCNPCDRRCVNDCGHRKCSRECHEKCDVSPCGRPCLRTLKKCGHQCSALCGEMCVCGKCDRVLRIEKSQSNEMGSNYERSSRKTSRLLKIPSCGHIFKLEEIDRYVKSEGEKLSTKFISCPKCSTPIQKCNRFEKILKENMQRREGKKTEPK